MKPTPESSTQEVLAGLVERVTFHNTENGFCVLLQDLGLGEQSFLMGNEAYASQYLDHFVPRHPRLNHVLMSPSGPINWKFGPRWSEALTTRETAST